MVAWALGCIGFQPHPPPDLLAVRHGAVYVEDHGVGDTLLLIHGFGADLESWRLLDLERDHRVIAMDTRGFGRSSRTAGDYSLPALADDVAAVLDAHGIDRARVLAHSWGSSIALELARRHPERVERVILADAFVYRGQEPWAWRSARIPVLGEWLTGGFYDADLERRLEEAFFDPAPLSWERVEEIRAEMARPETKAVVAAVARDVHLPSRWDGVAAPVSLIWGAGDRVTPLAWGRKLAGELDAPLEILDDCGHYPMLERPEAFEAAVRAALP